MKSYEVKRLIGASLESVWAVISNASLLRSGDFGITRIDGAIGPGATIKLWSELDPKRPFSLQLRLFEPFRHMTWVGGMPFGLLKGERQFMVTEAPGGTEFHICETFSGPLLGLFNGAMPDLGPSFDLFATGVQHHAEDTKP